MLQVDTGSRDRLRLEASRCEEDLAKLSGFHVETRRMELKALVDELLTEWKQEDAKG